MRDVTERWRTERVMAAMYDIGVKHDRVALVGAWAMWGADMRRMFADVARLADTPAGTSMLDIPCGAASPFASCVPASRCDTSRPTSLPTCSSGRAKWRIECGRKTRSSSSKPT